MRGEQIAAWFLARRGCIAVGRNLRVGPDEVDLVVLDGGRQVAVEVKYATGDRDPLDAVDAGKLDRLRRAVRTIDRPITRIDLVGVSVRRRSLAIRWLRAVG